TRSVTYVVDEAANLSPFPHQVLIANETLRLRSDRRHFKLAVMRSMTYGFNFKNSILLGAAGE
ncbi:MAG: hypothetical protein AAGG48_31970, partial [Planctomycetota bacterium]